LSLFTSHTAGAEDVDEVAVVAALTGDRGNTTYASQLLEERTRDEDEEKEETVVTELDEETRRRVEAEIERLIIPDIVEEVVSAERTDDEDVRERRGDGETSGEQQLTEDAVAVEAEDEETAAAAEGIIAGRAARCFV